jgi:hypothetical protein
VVVVLLQAAISPAPTTAAAAVSTIRRIQSALSFHIAVTTCGFAQGMLSHPR